MKMLGKMLISFTMWIALYKVGFWLYDVTGYLP